LKIKEFYILSEIETLDRLENTRLRGFGQPFIYRHAKLEIIEQCPVSELVPPQRYVLSGTVRAIINLYGLFKPLGVDIFSLRGALLFWTDEMDLSQPPIPFLPPIVEESIERDGRMVKLINDGMHRTFAARTLGRSPNIIFASNLPKEFPYYAWGFLEGWSGVRVFDELPDEFQKKDYRNPENYKALFRMFNEVFPGIQEQRKQSNPSHIKE